MVDSSLSEAPQRIVRPIDLTGIRKKSHNRPGRGRWPKDNSAEDQKNDGVSFKRGDIGEERKLKMPTMF
jgi:hypothetical protein